VQGHSAGLVKGSGGLSQRVFDMGGMGRIPARHAIGCFAQGISSNEASR
jgi:hypothetical protein